jgi:hypothetical protein
MCDFCACVSEAGNAVQARELISAWDHQLEEAGCPEHLDPKEELDLIRVLWSKLPDVFGSPATRCSGIGVDGDDCQRPASPSSSERASFAGARSSSQSIISVSWLLVGIAVFVARLRLCRAVLLCVHVRFGIFRAFPGLVDATVCSRELMSH